ncbi:MAG: aspartate carbamoyltransferase regulatory subunit [Clostridiales Family XIII bacterium]|jgi:aspartate carbamoyltransferase regulatory subunit|nr:aspartate carbamoyltransferase regulatory subunit [Clostridiales Family XIII bacterium]
MEVNSIENGIVIDHIRAGLGRKILSYMNIESGDTVALIMNATSKKHARKDIIKIENIREFDLAALAVLDHTATVNVIKQGKIVEKINLDLPEKVVDVLRCKNPRCVTSVEPAIPQIFHLVSPETVEYRCEYCDEIIKP